MKEDPNPEPAEKKPTRGPAKEHPYRLVIKHGRRELELGRGGFGWFSDIAADIAGTTPEDLLALRRFMREPEFEVQATDTDSFHVRDLAKRSVVATFLSEEDANEYAEKANAKARRK